MNGTTQPITKAVIDRVTELAKAQKAPEGLIFDDDPDVVLTLNDMDTSGNLDNDDASDKTYNPKKDKQSEIDTDSTL